MQHYGQLDSISYAVVAYKLLLLYQIKNFLSYVIANYQYGEPCLTEKVKMDLMATISADHTFDFLRTKHQLGYICFSMLPRIGDYYSFSIIVGSQRDKFTSEEVFSKILQYHDHFIKTLEEMSQDDFETHKRSLIQVKFFISYGLITLFKALNRSPTNLTERFTSHLSTLLSGESEIHFNTRQKKADLVYDITKNEIIEIYESKVRRNRSMVLIAVEGIHKKDIKAKASFELKSLTFNATAHIESENLDFLQFESLNALKTALQ